jgi:serine O-acetyltransferase
MSSKLANFLYQERTLKSQLTLNVLQLRVMVDEILALLYPQTGKIRLSTPEDAEAHIVFLRTRLIEALTALKNLRPELLTETETTVETYLNKLPEIARLLDLDAQAAFDGDPAARSIEEVIISYPGFFAIAVHRLAHALHVLKVPLLPRLMSEYAHERTGIDIHPGAQIGESFFIDHGTGVVIGETTIIGNKVKVYQGVTLGALSVKKRLQDRKRHPTIEEGVIIYANSTILGGETVIGKGSVIGGNVWLTQSVPEKSKIFSPQSSQD